MAILCLCGAASQCSRQLCLALGIAHLSVLRRRCLPGFEGKVLLHLVNASCNRGPTSVRRNVVRRCDLEDLSAEDLYALLASKSRRKTRDDFREVSQTMELY